MPEPLAVTEPIQAACDKPLGVQFFPAGHRLFRLRWQSAVRRRSAGHSRYSTIVSVTFSPAITAWPQDSLLRSIAPGMMDAAAYSSAPSSHGRVSHRISTSTPLRAAISDKCPHQAKAGDIGGRVGFEFDHEFGGGFVQCRQWILPRLPCWRRMLCRSEEANEMIPVPRGLVRISTSPTCAALLVLTLSLAMVPVTAKPALISASFDAVAADDGYARFFHFVDAAAKDFRKGTVGNFPHGETDHRQGSQGFSAHRIHIADRVSRGDLAERVWIIDGGREDIDCLNQALVVAHIINACIVTGWGRPTTTLASSGIGRSPSTSLRNAWSILDAQPAFSMSWVSLTSPVGAGHSFTPRTGRYYHF